MFMDPTHSAAAHRKKSAGIFSLPRFQFVEFEDLAWTPGFIRQANLELLRETVECFRLYDKAASVVDSSQKGDPYALFDLCSGAGGPLRRLAGELKADAIWLTDIYPQTALQFDHPKIRYLPTPVDPRQGLPAVPAGSPAVITIFTAFHHFRPEDAKCILRNVVASGRPFFAFEFSERSWINLLGVPTGVMIGALRGLFRGKFTLKALCFIFLVPLGFLMNVFDGIVSNLRAYTNEEWERLARESDPDGIYQWETCSLERRGPVPRLRYLRGFKRT
jgi:hypothetical protein